VPPRENHTKACLQSAARQFLRFDLTARMEEMRQFPAISGAMQLVFSAAQTVWRSEKDSNFKCRFSHASKSPHISTLQGLHPRNSHTGETYRDRPHDELVRFRRPSEWRRPGDHRAPRRCSRADSSLHRVRKWLLPYRAVRSAKRISRIGSSTRGPKTRVRGTFGLGSHFSGIITSPKPTSGSE
jgi:hypothetical protein